MALPDPGSTPSLAVDGREGMAGTRYATWMRSSGRGESSGPGYGSIAVGLQVVVGLAAIPIGLQLMADPEGAPLGLPQNWIDATPFGSWLVPGLFLLAMNGIASCSQQP